MTSTKDSGNEGQRERWLAGTRGSRSRMTGTRDRKNEGQQEQDDRYEGLRERGEAGAR